jgi:hypothetical protein
MLGPPYSEWGPRSTWYASFGLTVCHPGLMWWKHVKDWICQWKWTKHQMRNILSGNMSTIFILPPGVVEHNISHILCLYQSHCLLVIPCPEIPQEDLHLARFIVEFRPSTTAGTAKGLSHCLRMFDQTTPMIGSEVVNPCKYMYSPGLIDSLLFRCVWHTSITSQQVM